MPHENANLTAAPRCLEIGHQHSGQFVRFENKRLRLLCIDVTAINSQPEPKVTLVGFFKCDLKFREELGLRTTPTCGTVVSGDTGGAPGQLIRNRSGAWVHWHSVGEPQAFERETTGARQELTHRHWLAGR